MLRRSMLAVSLTGAVLVASSVLFAQSQGSGGGAAGQPSTRPSGLPADQLLSQMLRPNEAAARPLTPQPNPDVRDATSGRGAVAPGAPAMPLLREGTFVVDRTGRLTRGMVATATGTEAGAFEFVFDADGRTLKDPPMLILPNLKLQTMEDAVKAANRDLRFRITGVVTEYRGRNAVLIEKVIVVPDSVQLQN
jgi:hypothetical protein